MRRLHDVACTAIAVLLFPLVLLAAFCCRWVMSDQRKDGESE